MPEWINITPTHWVALSGVLFCIGLLGVIARRNVLIMLLSVEVMLNAGNLAFVAMARHLGDSQGEVIALIVMAIAAAEATVGLAFVVLLQRARRTLNPDALTTLQG